MSIQAREIRKHAKAWMVLNDVKNMDIQKALNMENHVQVSDTLRGRRSHRQVLQYLLDRGCPAEYLALPLDMREAI